MKRTLSAIALVLLSACSHSITGEVDGVEVRTSHDVYALPAGGNEPVQVDFTVRNNTTSPVQVAYCGARPVAVLERREGTAWTVVSSGFCTASLQLGPMYVGPGGQVQGVALVPRMSGTFRVRVPLGDPASADRHAVSQTFEVNWSDG